jgi:MerR family copper efflux transcriptional regulator
MKPSGTMRTMTIGQLSRRTGVPIKRLRTYESLGLLYTRGRSEGNYRLFGEEALQCVQGVQCLRALGLTLKEIQSLAIHSSQQFEGSVGELLYRYLAQALTRIETQISTLQTYRQRILEFQTVCAESPTRPEAFTLMRLLTRECCCSTFPSSS